MIYEHNKVDYRVPRGFRLVTEAESCLEYPKDCRVLWYYRDVCVWEPSKNEMCWGNNHTKFAVPLDYVFEENRDEGWYISAHNGPIFTDKPSSIPGEWVSISDAEFQYAQNRPEPVNGLEWRLAFPQKGDLVYGQYGAVVVWLLSESNSSRGSYWLRGYRWCISPGPFRDWMYVDDVNGWLCLGNYDRRYVELRPKGFVWKPVKKGDTYVAWRTPNIHELLLAELDAPTRGSLRGHRWVLKEDWWFEPSLKVVQKAAVSPGPLWVEISDEEKRYFDARPEEIRNTDEFITYELRRPQKGERYVTKGGGVVVTHCSGVNEEFLMGLRWTKSVYRLVTQWVKQS